MSLQARKQEFVRAAIWAAATDLFAEKGFEETTIDDRGGGRDIAAHVLPIL
jgi:AcrR family transcriptional regulator